MGFFSGVMHLQLSCVACVFGFGLDGRCFYCVL